MDKARLIQTLPKEHQPAPYEVVVTKKGCPVATRYVRASSPQRAVIAAVYWNNTISRDKADSGSALIMMPNKTERNQTRSLSL